MREFKDLTDEEIEYFCTSAFKTLNFKILDFESIKRVFNDDIECIDVCFKTAEPYPDDDISFEEDNIITLTINSVTSTDNTINCDSRLNNLWDKFLYARGISPLMIDNPYLTEYIDNLIYADKVSGIINDFCNGTIAVKINSQEELDNLIKLVHEEDKKINCSLSDCNGYNKNFPYYFIREAILDESHNLLDAVEDMKYLDTRYHSLINGIKHITEYVDFKDKTLHTNENKLMKNKTQYER